MQAYKAWGSPNIPAHKWGGGGGPPLGGINGIGPKLALKASKIYGAAHFYLLKLSVFKKLRLGGLRARF